MILKNCRGASVKKTIFSNLKPDLQLYRKGIKLMRNGEYSSAIENFMEFLSLYPGSYYWRFALNRYIQIMYLLNKDDEVERIFSSFENSNISYKNGNYLIGIKADYYRKNNRSSEAFALLNAACAAASDSKTRKRFKF